MVRRRRLQRTKLSTQRKSLLRKSPRRKTLRRKTLRCESLEQRRLLAADIGSSEWSIAEDAKPQFAKNAPQPSEFTAFTLQDNAFRDRAATASLEFMLGPEEPADLRPNRVNGRISIPSPGGKLSEFKLLRTKVMSDDLAKQLPGVETYKGFATDGSHSSIRVTTNPTGIHVQVRNATGTYYVRQIEQADPSASPLYMSYYLRDLAPAEGDRFSNTLEEHLARTSYDDYEGDLADGLLNDQAPPPQQNTGTERRVYRMAVAATGEFTARHGGVVGAQTKIVEAINDANDLYENQMSIRFELINNTSIIYTDAGTDPYTNNNNLTMLGENQTNLDNMIGNANYDIGHVFGTNGGGVASVGVAGRDGLKARGVSSNNLNFSTQTVSHEIGHQFSSRHTWNGANNSCSPDQWNQDYSMEPGSGSTIMSYGGFCGVDNIQTFRDNYFHSVSFDGIVSHALNRIGGVGSIEPLTNSPPNVSAGPDYTIPAETPFELTAPTATDADSDPLVYNWEQRDLGGAARALAAGDDGLTPLFRSYQHDSDINRTLPRLSDLLNNTAPLGETLPTTDRELNFRLTALDGQGGNSSDEMKIDVVATGAPFRVTSPNTNVSWPALSNQTVTWDTAGTEANGIDAGFVDILLSTDGGQTFDQLLASSVPNDGSQPIAIPDTQTSNARIKVKPVGNIFFDFSDTEFTITEAVFTQDFGDAPSPYPTILGEGGPSHVVGSLYLGSTVDTEGDGQPSANATGDGFDEDGLTIDLPLVRGQSADLEVQASAAGELDMFIDFDGNGVFGNTSDEVIRRSLVAGTNTVSISIPATAVEDTFARLRFSSTGNLTPAGPATDGEVEDYAIRIFQTAPEVDYGDVPIFVEQVSDPGRHVITGPQLGSMVDGESTNYSFNATSDGRDDDGIYFRELLEPGTTASIEVIADQAAQLDFFFDFDQSGTFDVGTNEQFSRSVSAGSQTIQIDIPAGAALGTTFARFRISENGGLGPYGLATSGEVEDYQVVLVSTTNAGLEDFDSVQVPDLPDGWTTNNDGNPDSNPWDSVPNNAASQPNSMFVANIGTVSEGILKSPIFPVDVLNPVISFQNRYLTETTYDGGVLEVSINGEDFVDIQDAGNFLQGGYNLVLSSQYGNPLGGRGAWSGSSGGYILTQAQLTDVALGDTVQFQWFLGTDSSVTSIGWNIDDVSFTGLNAQYDFGDALGTNYPTLLADDGATHLIRGDEFLGFAAPDSESDGIPTAGFDGDDLDGSMDEDSNAVLVDIDPNSGDAALTVFHSDILGSILNVWIDLDLDGSWDDPLEHVVKDFGNLSSTQGVSTVAINLPPDLTSGSYPTRARLSAQAGLSFDGAAGSGEVEDFLTTIDVPTSVQVDSIEINEGHQGRSQVTSLEVTFDGVTAADPAAFSVRNRADDSSVPVMAMITEENGKTKATITFTTGANVETRSLLNSLVDGNFELIIAHSLVPGMNSDYRFGDQAADNFFRLYGDSDGDRDVDGLDLGAFGQAFLTTAGQPAYNANLDSEGDGDIDGLDLGAFGQRFLNTMPF